MLIGALAQYFFGFTIFVLSTFLVLLVLVQRGRGGGLTGALGGPGGQSAFGTKAGDLFTRITVGVAAAWILLCATAVFMLRNRALPETGGADRPVAKGDAAGGGMGASSGTTGTSESTSSLPKFDPSNLSMPKIELPSSSSLLGEGTAKPASSAPSTPAPSDTPPAPPATLPTDTPPAPTSTTPVVEPAAPATTPELTPSAPTGTETPPAPK